MPSEGKMLNMTTWQARFLRKESYASSRLLLQLDASFKSSGYTDWPNCVLCVMFSGTWNCGSHVHGWPGSNLCQVVWRWLQGVCGPFWSSLHLIPPCFSCYFMTLSSLAHFSSAGALCFQTWCLPLSPRVRQHCATPLKYSKESYGWLIGWALSGGPSPPHLGSLEIPMCARG